ncbi:MAG: hypothetical protein HC902_02745 [Calothrix sp. SM1_5_4]|nr:hypothetical protein [Calothrix sp. SM1_5_4]
MRVDQSGNVGIGTTTPARKLHVAGPMRLDPAALPGSPAAGDIAIDSGASNALKYHDGTSWVTLGAGSGDFMKDGSVAMTGTLKHVAGTAAAPGLTFAGDTANGVFAPAANTLAVSTSGTERLRVDSSGNVGIGTSSPTAKVEISTDENSALKLVNTEESATLTLGVNTDSVLYLQNADGNLSLSPQSIVANQGGDLFALVNMGGDFNFSGGNVGIGTISPGTPLDVNGAITSRPTGTGAGQTGQLIMRELAANGTNAVTLKAPDDLASDLSFTLPSTAGTNGQVLSTNGSGVLSWVSAGGGSGDFMADGTVSMTGAFKAAAGSAAAPSISFAGDPNTGIYNGSADEITFASNGFNVAGISGAGVRIFNSYNLQVGNVCSYKICVGVSASGGAENTVPTIANTANVWGIGANQAPSGGGAGLFLTAGAPTSTTTDGAGGTLVLASGASTGAGSSDIRFMTATAGTSGTTARAATEKMRIAGDGKVGIGTTSPTQALDVNGTVRAVDIILTSDSRAKHDIVTLDHKEALEKICRVNPVAFKWNHSGKADEGVIAQELRRIFPEMVIENSDGSLSVKYNSLIAPLIASVQELNKQNHDMNDRVKQLEEENKKLREDVQMILRELASRKK